MVKKEKLLVILIIGLGFLLRIWRLRELMGFDYDQEAAAFAVDSILSGKITLIGQQLSVGGVFIGPGYYYLLAIFYWLFSRDPIGAGVMVALISIITMAVLFVLTKSLFDNKTALIALLIYATSSKINFYDRTTAPSNPVMLASLLTIYLLWQMRKGKAQLTPLLVTTALVATIHLHPSAVVLVPLIITLWIHWKLLRPSPKSIFASLLATFFVMNPLLLFDIRHDFLNLKGVINSLKGPGDEAYSFPFKLLVTLRIQVENFASLLVANRGIDAVLAVFTLLFWKISKPRHERLLLFWILIPALIFSFYKRHIPEYYFLVSLPAMVIIIATALRLIATKWSIKMSWLLLTMMIVANLNALNGAVNPYSLKYKQQAVNLIREQGDSQASVAFNTELGLDAGFRFLLKQVGIDFDSEKAPTHIIVIPPQRQIEAAKEHIFGGVKVIESQTTVEQ